LHGLFALDGTPRALALTSPKVGEREVCLDMLTRMPRAGQVTIIGDKGYAGRDFCAQAAELGAVIIRPRRKDEPGRGPHLAPIRQRVESIFQTAKDMLGLEGHRARELRYPAHPPGREVPRADRSDRAQRTPRPPRPQPHRLLRLTHDPWNDSSRPPRAAQRRRWRP